MSTASAVFASIGRQCAATRPASMTRAELLTMLNELVAYNETSLTSRAPSSATMVAKVSKAVGGSGGSSMASFSQPTSDPSASSSSSSSGGPLIRVEEEHKLPLSLWGAVLPWEIQRGYSNTPASVVCGRDGMPAGVKRASVGEDTNASGEAMSDEDLLKDDPLAVVSSSSPSVADLSPEARRAMAAKEALRADRRLLEKSNGVLFVHRERDAPQYWSGGIQSALDVSFLALPADEGAVDSARFAQKGILAARNGLTADPYQRLGRPHGAGYGLADDPGPYHYYLKTQKEMSLTIESTAFLDPFPSVINAMPVELGGEGQVFCGDHFSGTQNARMDQRFQCQPGRGVRVPITAILETRRRLIRDFLRTCDAGGSDMVTLNLLLSAEFMRVLEEKEMFYRDLVEALENKVTSELEACHKPIVHRGPADNNAEDAKKKASGSSSSVFSRPLEAWREQRNAKASTEDRLAEVPPAAAPTRLGTDGSFSLSKMRSASRVSNTMPDMPVTPPVDVELFAAATRLGLSHTAQQRILPRLINDLRRQYVEDSDVETLYSLATDPSVQVYPTELSVAIHQAKERLSLKREYEANRPQQSQ